MKKLRIVSLVLLLVGIVLLVGVMVLFSLGRINFGNIFRVEKQVEIFSKTESMTGINEISLDLASADIRIIPADVDEVTVTYKGPESKKDDPDVTVGVQDGVLKVIQKNTNFFYLFSWNFTQRLVEIKIPESYTGQLSVLNKSGNLTIDGNYTFASYHSDVASGDISIETLSTSDFTLRCTSGNTKIGTLKAANFDIHVTSGGTKIDELTGDGTIKTSSGNVVILLLNGRADLSTTSGNTTVNEWKGYGSMHCSSGNLEVAISESTGDMTIDTTSGNIKVSLSEKTAYQVNASVVSGDINSDIPFTYVGNDKNSAVGDFGTNPTNSLTVKATSGNIRITA